jgi:hypothetical protein
MPRKYTLRSVKSTWQDNFKVDTEDKGWKSTGTDWIHLV